MSAYVSLLPISLRPKEPQTQELHFDLVSPVDELAKQIRMEFDFEREAEVMDIIGGHLRVRLRFLSAASSCRFALQLLSCCMSDGFPTSAAWNHRRRVWASALRFPPACRG